MAKRDERIEDPSAGHDPTEEVGPEEASAGVPECEFKVGALDEKPEAMHPKFSEELLEAFAPEPDLLIPHPIDGLPVPADERSSDDAQFAPPFTYDTVVCVEDDRAYAEVFAEEAPELFAGHVSVVVGQGVVVRSRSQWKTDGTLRDRITATPERVTRRFGHLLADSIDDPGSFILVRPIRPRCKYYMRQIFSNDAIPDPREPGHKIVFRNCTIRRSVGGAFLSLRDEAVYACDYRDPPDPRSVEQHLDEPDRKQIRSTDYKVKLPLFKHVPPPIEPKVSVDRLRIPRLDAELVTFIGERDGAVSVSELANFLGVEEQYVRRWARDHDVKRLGQNFAFTLETAALCKMDMDAKIERRTEQ